MKIINKIRTLVFFFKPRKIVAQCKLFYGDEWLELSVNSIANYIYKIIFVISDIPWGKKNAYKGDDLEPIIEKLKQKYGEKIVIYRGSWDDQEKQVNAGLDYIKQNIPEATHCLYIDGDEIYTKDQIKKLISLTRKIKYFNKAIRISSHTYFKSIYYRIYPDKSPKLLALFPLRDYIKYYDARNVTAAIAELQIYFHHFAYVRRSNERMKGKIETHKASEPIIDNWYENIWLKWTPETINFHPFKPDFFHSVIKVKPVDLPEGVVEAYNKWQ